jgi:uncharacterized protein YndB with AHSA1/START domain
MTTQTADTTLRLTRTFDQSPERVFSAWTTPTEMKQWCAPEGVDVLVAEADLKVGGKYHIRMRNPEGTVFNAVGTYREIDRPHKLVYTWRWEEKENDVGETLVTVEFKAEGKGTKLILLHELFPNAEAREGHNQGWTSCLNRLATLLG